MTRHAKGTNVIPVVKAARKALRAGVDLGLDAEERTLIESRLLPSKWYSFDLFERLLTKVHRRGFGGSDEAARRLGETASRETLKGVHRAFLVPGDPGATAGRLTVIWATFFDFGYLEVGTKASSATVTIRGYENAGRCHCNVLAGFLRAAVALSGATVGDLEILEEPWSGGRNFVVRISWSRTGESS